MHDKRTMMRSELINDSGVDNVYKVNAVGKDSSQRDWGDRPDPRTGKKRNNPDNNGQLAATAAPQQKDNKPGNNVPAKAPSLDDVILNESALAVLDAASKPTVEITAAKPALPASLQKSIEPIAPIPPDGTLPPGQNKGGGSINITA